MLKIAFSPIYKYKLPDQHRFPMIKYELLPEQLLYEGTVSEQQFFEPQKLAVKEILSIHTAIYWESLKSQTLSPRAARKIGFPMLPELVERGRYISKGTIECAYYALQYGISMNIAGGTHHAYADHGEGFCVFNDMALAASHLLRNNLAKKILFVDLDVHQGNGNAHIFKNEKAVFTFSMHGAKNYPHRKETSNLDIGLPDKTGDRKYLSILQNNLEHILDDFKPDFVFYQCGVDVLESDKLGRLSLSRKGCKRRDQFVLQKAKNYKIPIVCVMGGGYSPQIKDIIEAHANTFRVAQDVFF